VGFEALTAVVMKIAIFWVVARWFIAWLIFDPEIGGYTLLQNAGSFTDFTALFARR
jgi:hypothetical protein